MVIKNQNTIDAYGEFALNYLGIDLEDYIELITDYDVEDEELDYSLSVWYIDRRSSVSKYKLFWGVSITVITLDLQFRNKDSISLRSIGNTIPKLPTYIFTMSAKLIAFAAEIVDENPAGAQLILNLTKAETGAEILEALDNYDSALIENNVQSVEDAVAVWIPILIN